MTPRRDDDHQTHLEVAHENYVAHLEAMLDQGNAALGWLQAWPNQITNSEPDMETLINLLRVALRRAAQHDEVLDGAYERVSEARQTAVARFDEAGDVTWPGVP